MPFGEYSVHIARRNEFRVSRNASSGWCRASCLKLPEIASSASRSGPIEDTFDDGSSRLSQLVYIDFYKLLILNRSRYEIRYDCRNVVTIRLRDVWKWSELVAQGKSQMEMLPTNDFYYSPDLLHFDTLIMKIYYATDII